MIYVFFGLVSYLIQLSEQKLPDDDSPNNNNAVTVNSADDDLNQALLLVDMLKSEYLKLLRSHSGVAESGTQNMDLSTCAATTGLENPIFITMRKENIVSQKDEKEFREPAPITGESTPLWHPAAQVTPSYPKHQWPRTGTSSNQQGLPTTLYNIPLQFRKRPSHRRIGRHWGRFFPDYHSYSVHPRRFYRNPPLKTRSTTLATASPSAIAVHTTVIEKLLRLPSKSEPSTTSSKATTFSTTKRTTTHRPTSTTPQRTTKRHTFHRKTSKHMRTNLITTVNTNPVEAEVASELLKEFKEINITLKPKTSKPSVNSASTE